MKILYTLNRFILGATLAVFVLAGSGSCSNKCEDCDIVWPDTEQTVFMYLPWSGPSNALTDYFYGNISDFESIIATMNLKTERVLAFICDPADQAVLYELKGSRGNKQRRILKRYSFPNVEYVTAAGITAILNDVKRFAPAERYAMTVGCHGLGWLPVSAVRAQLAGEKMHWEYEGEDGRPLTRYFGGTSSKYQIDVTAFAQGIAGARIKMDYVLFDDCYMSTIEVAYDMKNVTDYIIACPTEIMAHGMPYDRIGKYLIGQPDYAAVVDAFYAFYSSYSYPYGTIGITDCSEVDALATIMKEINQRFTFDPALLNSVQMMDGYHPIIFFDYGDYVAKLYTDNIDRELLDRFETQLRKAVPHKKHTPEYYSSRMGETTINTYSGMTISDPSTHQLASTKTGTAWWAATH